MYNRGQARTRGKVMQQEDLFIKPGVVIPVGELDFSVSRASGPGGQHVNKTSTRVTVTWDLSKTQVLSPEQLERLYEKLAARITQEQQLQIHVDESRSQLRNKEIALARLAELVRQGLHQPKARKQTKPTRSSQRRRVDQKKQRGQVKQARKKPTRQDW